MVQLESNTMRNICPHYCSTDREPLCWLCCGICYGNPYGYCEMRAEDEEEENEEEDDD